MSQLITVVDAGSASQSKFPDMEVTIPSSSSPITGYKFAQLGLQVDAPTSVNPGSFSTVHLHGTIGVQNPALSASTVRVVITRRNTLLLGAPEISIFETDYTITPQILGVAGLGHATIAFNTHDGDIINTLPPSYYSYSAYVELSPLLLLPPIPNPILVGPATLEGESYVRNT